MKEEKKEFRRNIEKFKRELLLRAKEFCKTLPTIKCIDWVTKEDVSKYVKINVSSF